MRIYEFAPQQTPTGQDPVFDDPEMVKVLAHYFGNNNIKNLYASSPYNPNADWKTRASKGIYDKIVRDVKPLLQQTPVNVNAVLSVINKGLPWGVSIPSQITTMVMAQDKRDQAAAASEQAAKITKVKPVDDKPADTWVIAGEPPQAMAKP